MKTVSVGIENLFVPCRCHCRHCLLSASGKPSGVDYHRGQAFAERFYAWVQKNRPDLGFFFYVGNCMDFPELPEYIQFTKRLTPWLDILKLDGMELRAEAETAALLRSMREAGARGIDLTFYGVGDYHDRFAARKGDFDYLLLLLRKAKQEGMVVQASIALIQENVDQMPELFRILEENSVDSMFCFLPHAKGRGENLSSQRLTQADFERLCPTAKDHFSRVPHYTETAWLERKTLPTASERSLILSLRADTIDRLEQMDPAEILAELEQMDDAYYAALPPMEQLAKQYGRPENQQLFRLRDLYLQWQKRYLREHPLEGPDMNDERYSFSVRVYDET